MKTDSIEAVMDDFRYYRRAVQLRDLLTQWIDKADEVGTGGDILLSENLNAMPPNLVVAVMRKLQRECEELKPQIRTAAIALAKQQVRRD